jgi:hypothetical protein
VFRKVVLIVVCIAALLSGALASVRAASDAPLSSEELGKLAAGKLVTRPSVEHRGDLNLLGGSSWQVVDSSVDAVWRAVLDTAHYKKMIPAVSNAHAVVNQDDYRVVHMEHKAGPIGTSYDLSMRIYADKRDVTFALEKSPNSGLRAAWGFITVRPYGEKRSLLSYGVMTDPGEGLLLTVLRSSVHEWVLRVPEQMKRFVESHTGRALYAAKTK